MLHAPSLRERLTGGTAAIGVQAGLLMLLLFSFNVVRQAAKEKETFLVLPPLARPVLPRPAIIDARQPAGPKPSVARPQNPAPPLPAAPPVLAPPTAPGDAFSMAPAQAGAGCGARSGCPAPHAGSPSDEIELNPESHVKNAPVWQSEIERRNTPPRVPCVSATSGSVGMDGFQREDHGVRLDLTCALQKWRNPALLPPVSGMPVADPGPRHASDEAFTKALQAANARKRMVSRTAAGVAP